MEAMREQSRGGKRQGKKENCKDKLKTTEKGPVLSADAETNQLLCDGRYYPRKEGIQTAENK